MNKLLNSDVGVDQLLTPIAVFVLNEQTTRKSVQFNMFAILVAFLVSVGLRLTLAECPFQQALENGQLSASLYDQQKHQLIDEKYMLNDGQPASFFWQSQTLTDETLARFERSTSLLLAKQFYVQQSLVNDPHDGRHADELLRSAAICLPEHYRCDPKPECDEDYRYFG